MKKVVAAFVGLLLMLTVIFVVEKMLLSVPQRAFSEIILLFETAALLFLFVGLTIDKALMYLRAISDDGNGNHTHDYTASFVILFSGIGVSALIYLGTSFALRNLERLP